MEESPFFSTLHDTDTVIATIQSHQLLSNSEQDRVEKEVGRLYIESFGNRVDGVRGVLLSKTWFAFDLDDTLEQPTSERKCGALSLLECLKQIGKKIAVITERHREAGDADLRRLGLSDLVDLLIAADPLSKSQVYPLHRETLKNLNINPYEMVYTGSPVRDVSPAQKEGMYCIRYTEVDNFSLESVPPKINTLRKLEYILNVPDIMPNFRPITP